MIASAAIMRAPKIRCRACDEQWRLPCSVISRCAVHLLQGIMGKFKKNSAMLNNQGIDVVVNRTEEPLMKLKKRSKPLKVRHTSKQ